MKAPIIGINRHRILTDGNGITTLVGFYGCPLKCKYCLNPQSTSPSFKPQSIKVDDLINELMIDDLYFKSTNGGICFTGGEPLIYPEFIKEVRMKAPKEWKITIETSLNVPPKAIKIILKSVDYLIIDLKALNNELYKTYTGQDNSLVIDNLINLSKYYPKDKMTIRVPYIPEYTSPYKLLSQDINLEELGLQDRVKNFTYIKSRNDHFLDIQDKITEIKERINKQIRIGDRKEHNRECENKGVLLGKAICCVLKDIRKKIAKDNGILYNPEDCLHGVQCTGTCPRCDKELKTLTNLCKEIPEIDLLEIIYNCSSFSPIVRKLKTDSHFEIFGRSIDSIPTLYQVLSSEPNKPLGQEGLLEGFMHVPEKYCSVTGPIQGDIQNNN